MISLNQFVFTIHECLRFAAKSENEYEHYERTIHIKFYADEVNKWMFVSFESKVLSNPFLE